MISDREGFTKEFGRMVDACGLGDWHIKIRFLPDMDDAWAKIRPSPHAGYALLDVGEDLFAEPWSYQRTVMLHELMHLVMRDLMLHYQEAVAALDITEGERALVTAGTKQHEELIVDRLARVIEKAMR